MKKQSKKTTTKKTTQSKRKTAPKKDKVLSIEQEQESGNVSSEQESKKAVLVDDLCDIVNGDKLFIMQHTDADVKDTERLLTASEDLVDLEAKVRTVIDELASKLGITVKSKLILLIDRR